MKTSILVILAASLTFALVGCGGGSGSGTANNASTPFSNNPTALDPATGTAQNVFFKFTNSYVQDHVASEKSLPVSGNLQFNWVNDYITGSSYFNVNVYLTDADNIFNNNMVNHVPVTTNAVKIATFTDSTTRGGNDFLVLTRPSVNVINTVVGGNFDISNINTTSAFSPAKRIGVILEACLTEKDNSGKPICDVISNNIILP